MTDLPIAAYKIKNLPNSTNPVSQYSLETQSSWMLRDTHNSSIY